MANGKYVSYCRVSTQKQGSSGLGLESQQKAIADYLDGGSWELIGEYVEVESGKKNDRPKLNDALRQCSLTGSTLIIAKLDRLARNVAFISKLMESNVEFIAVDFPEANRLTVHILAAVAEHEGRNISERIKVAYQAYLARGGKQYNFEHGRNGWGSPENLTPEHQAKGSGNGNKQKKIKADLFAIKVYPMIQGHQEQDLSLRQIAKLFNEQGILSARGKVGSWTATAVRNIINRQYLLAS